MKIANHIVRMELDGGSLHPAGGLLELRRGDILDALAEPAALEPVLGGFLAAGGGREGEGEGERG